MHILYRPCKGNERIQTYFYDLILLEWICSYYKKSITTIMIISCPKIIALHILMVFYVISYTQLRNEVCISAFNNHDWLESSIFSSTIQEVPKTQLQNNAGYMKKI